MKDTDWKKKCQELENEMVLIKGITITNSPELREANKKIKELENRMAEVLSIEDDHQKLNGKLNMRVAELEEFNIKVRQEVTVKEQEILELHADNKKLSKQIEDQVDRLRKSGM
jgi:chromosome segregation ATPase